MKLVNSDYEIATLEDELRVDALCRELLLAFYSDRLGAGIDEHEATLLANSADYFIRDFLIGARQLNILEPGSGVVRKFAGNWYIVNTLEPDSSELEAHLKGICEFYRFLAAHQAITAAAFREIESECQDSGYYRQRIDSFWDIKGDGYFAWEEECSLKNG
jgi:hypothetical protein